MSTPTTHYRVAVVLTSFFFMLSADAASANEASQASRDLLEKTTIWVAAGAFCLPILFALGAVIGDVWANTQATQATQVTERPLDLVSGGYLTAAEYQRLEELHVATCNRVRSRAAQAPTPTPTPTPTEASQAPGLGAPASEQKKESAPASEQKKESAPASEQKKESARATKKSTSMTKIVGAVRREGGVWRKGQNALARAAKVSPSTVTAAVKTGVLVKREEGGIQLAA